jgi:hypothetical protein
MNHHHHHQYGTLKHDDDTKWYRMSQSHNAQLIFAKYEARTGQQMTTTATEPGEEAGDDGRQRIRT